MGSCEQLRESESAWRYASSVGGFRIRTGLKIELSTLNGRYQQDYEQHAWSPRFDR